MSSIEEKIHSAASKNHELLTILSETDYAPSALEQQQKYIDDLTRQQKELDSRNNELENKRQKELKDHEKYRDSVMKRFAYRMGGKTDKFEAKAQKEEKEYFDCLHEKHQVEAHLKSLHSTLSEAQSQKSQFESAVQKHRKAQSDLNALYDSIFEGPSPGFPDEDASESAAQSALDQYHNTSTQYESECRALDLLARAGGAMQAAMKAMDSARGHSQMDMFGGGMMSDMMERNALSQAETRSNEVQMLVSQAQNMSRSVGNVPKAQIAQGNMLSDVLFDNVFTDYQFHQKIKQAQDEMNTSGQVLQTEWQKCKERVDQLNAKVKEEGKALEGKRVDLQSQRVKAFEKVLGGTK